MIFVVVNFIILHPLAAIKMYADEQIASTLRHCISLCSTLKAKNYGCVVSASVLCNSSTVPEAFSCL